MLNRKTPETLALDLKIKAPGDEFTVPVVFNNRTQDEIKAKAEELANSEQGKEDPEWVNREVFCYLVREFNGHTPTNDAVKKLEMDYPGIVMGVGFKYHEARQVQVVKN